MVVGLVIKKVYQLAQVGAVTVTDEYKCCPPSDCQCLWFSIITELACII